jgi:hypothetical protein
MYVTRLIIIYNGEYLLSLENFFMKREKELGEIERGSLKGNKKTDS